MGRIVHMCTTSSHAACATKLCGLCCLLEVSCLALTLALLALLFSDIVSSCCDVTLTWSKKAATVCQANLRAMATTLITLGSACALVVITLHCGTPQDSLKFWLDLS